MQHEPTKRQLQEFWEWCGFTFIYNFDNPEVIEESRNPIGERLNPVLDLNNLFKYAVPKLHYTVHLVKPNYDKENLVEIYDAELSQMYSEDRIVTRNQDPALALFWAIWEVIKQK